MNKSEMMQNVLMGLVVSIMLGVLYFLYDKTQAVDLREQNEVMSLLNQVKEIDSRWDMEVQRARIDLSNQEIVFVRADAGEKALRDITRFAGITSSKALRTGLPELRSAIQLKSDLFQKFISENKSNKAILQELLKDVAELNAQFRAKPTSEFMNGLSLLDKFAPQYYLHGEDSQRVNLQTALA